MSHVNRIIFLLIFSLATDQGMGHTACEGGWVNFTCPDNNSLQTHRTRITENEDHSFTVVVKNLQQEDQRILCPTLKKRKIKIVNCTQPQVNHMAYNKGQTTIECGRPGSSNKFGHVYLCKETADFDFKNVSSINSYEKKYFESRDSSGLNVTITNITSEDEGIYWCAVPEYYVYKSYRRISITVRSNFTDCMKDFVIARDLQYTCNYTKEHPGSKFFCKGEDPLDCDHLVTRAEFSLVDDFENKSISVEIFNMTKEDEGIYWFGAENTKKHGKEIYCRLELTAVSDSAVIPDQTPPNVLDAVSFLSVIIVLCVCVVVLVLLVPILLIVESRKRRNDSLPQSNRRGELVYEEIQMPASVEAVTTVYATADACKESLHYMTIDFEKRGGSSEPKPSASHCEYSTVFTKSTDQCTISTAPSEDPLYSNVKKHK